jgi:hypothetical protein
VDGDSLTASSPPHQAPQPLTSLDAALASHGPLSAPSAIVVALRLCADASALTPADLGRSIGDLATTAIVRDVDGAWRWRPAQSGALDRRPTDNEIASRIGAVLFECLCGEPLRDYLPDPAAVRARLREGCPGLSQAVIDLCARLASARSGARVALDDVAAELRSAVGVHDIPSRRRQGLWLAGALLLVGTLAIAVGLAGGDGAQSRTEAHGLTPEETTLADVAVDGADFWTVRREFITAFDFLAGVERIWRSRLQNDDPRVASIHHRQAWARMERGDFLTAEQILTGLIGPLERQLGTAHPYVRAARLNLATVLDLRGARDLAREQRAMSAAALRQLPVQALTELLETSGAPIAPGILAHVTPNAPEREWFRQVPGGGYFAPLTAVSRWMAGQRGWRLHVTTTAMCEVAADVSRDPRRIQVSVRRADDGWRVRVEGVRPVVDLRAAESPAGRVPVTLDAEPDGTVRVMVPGAAPVTTAIDPDVALPPPYGLAFGPASGHDGCALVWWEVKPQPPPGS